MNAPVADPPASELIAWAVEAFETAVAANPEVGLAAFLPLSGDPHRREVIAELVRVHMELAWRRGAPIPLAEYLLRWPILASEPKTLNSVAFEEYRQRRLRGDDADPAEYAQTHGIDVALWPPIRPLSSGYSRVRSVGS